MSKDPNDFLPARKECCVCGLVRRVSNYWDPCHFGDDSIYIYIKYSLLYLSLPAVKVRSIIVHSCRYQLPWAGGIGLRVIGSNCFNHQRYLSSLHPPVFLQIRKFGYAPNGNTGSCALRVELKIIQSSMSLSIKIYIYMSYISRNFTEFGSRR